MKLQDIERPEVRDNEVLIRVRAASVHVGDWAVMRGVPYVMRVVFWLRRPKNGVPGMDVAGVIEAVGKDVSALRPGDAVFGCCTGAFAEYARANASNVVLKPTSLTFEQAAAVPTSALAALMAIRDQGKVQPRQKVLINGASGGVGTFAVQIAKSFGAEVTGVCSTKNVDTVRSLGADHVIDYKAEDFTKGAQRYDLILDNVANHSLSECRRTLTPKGVLLPNGGGHSLGGWFGPMGNIFKASVLSVFVRKQGGPFLSMPNQADLVVLRELIEAGKLRPVIDRTYPLSETPAAMSYIGEGHARGKIVISV